jgi:ABC-2 type transport system permease protein
VTALAAEWAKLRTIPATAWLIVACAASLLVVGPALVAATDPSLTAGRCPAGGCSPDLVRTALTGTWLAQAVAALVGVLAATSEYTHRTIVPTLTATPGRVRLGAAKLLVTTATVVVTGGVGALGAVAVAGILPERAGLVPDAGFTAVGLTSGPALEAAAGTALYLGAVAALGAGAGLLVRDTAAAATTVLGLLCLGPVVAQLMGDPDWSERIERLAPTVGLAVQATVGIDSLPLTPWPGLAVTAAYAVAGATAGLVALRRRDV